jgi:hypothetical protein
MKYAISSHQATVYGISCFAYLMLRSTFERMKGRAQLLGHIERQFNSLALRLGSSVLNAKLVGPRLFDAVELHLTDPRIFYNPFEWKINERMIKLVGGPISSFHAHVETNPFLRKYVFNLCDASTRTRKAIRSQLEAAYKVMRTHPGLIMTENPVFVFHAGVAKGERDREKALGRTRESIEYIAIANNQLYQKYGRHRKLIPTIENSAREALSLCQTTEEWRRSIQGFEDEVKLTLDYGHIGTVHGQKRQLLTELKEGELGDHIVGLHLHYSPRIGNERQHAHAPLSNIPESNLDDVRNDLVEILSHTKIREQGFITLEVPSKELLDYIPSLRHLRRQISIASRMVKSVGIFDWSAFRGDIEDQLASLELAREMTRA